MRRSEREIKDFQEIEKILKKSDIGILGLTADNVPYTVPVNFVYINGSVFFHSADSGRKIEALRKNDKVSFVTFIKGSIVADNPPCDITQSYKSVMISGRAVFVSDIETKRIVLTELIRKYYPHRDYLSLNNGNVKNYSSSVKSKTEVIQISINALTGKLNSWDEQVH